MARRTRTADEQRAGTAGKLAVSLSALARHTDLAELANSGRLLALAPDELDELARLLAALRRDLDLADRDLTVLRESTG